MITIIDYDIGSVNSILNMAHRLGLPCRISAREDDIITADHLILPGNGSFDACLKNLRSTGLVPAIEQQVLRNNTPLLGICVGAQMLGLASAEGVEPGLGFLDMQVVRFPILDGYRIPHMGWNSVQVQYLSHPLAKSLDPDTRFYYVHSFYMSPNNESDILFKTFYGINFTSGVARGNIVGVQFHPEKSHRYGKQLLTNFAMLRR